jgi:hypothetical protein
MQQAGYNDYILFTNCLLQPQLVFKVAFAVPMATRKITCRVRAGQPSVLTSQRMIQGSKNSWSLWGNHHGRLVGGVSTYNAV